MTSFFASHYIICKVIFKSFSSPYRLVFDECDRMLELGYKRDVQSVLNAINEQSEKKRQTLLLSATLTQGMAILVWNFHRKNIF